MQKLLSILFLGLLVVASGCGDDNENQVKLSDEETLALISTSFTGEAGGLNQHFAEFDVLVNEIEAGSQGGRAAGFCDITDELSFNYESSASDPFDMSMSYNWSFTTSCNGANVLDAIAYDLDFISTMDMEELSMDFNGDVSMTAEGLAGESMVFNGKYDVALNLDATGDNDFNGTHQFNYTLSDITVVNASGKVTGGSAQLSGKGSTSKGTYQYNAQLVYNGNGTIAITINGSVYTLDEMSGAVLN